MVFDVKSFALEAAEAVARGDATHEEIESAIVESLKEKSEGIPPKNIAYTSSFGGLYYTKGFKAFCSELDDPFDPEENYDSFYTETTRARMSTVDAMEEYGIACSEKWPRASRTLRVCSDPVVQNLFTENKITKPTEYDSEEEIEKKRERRSIKMEELREEISNKYGKDAEFIVEEVFREKTVNGNLYEDIRHMLKKCEYERSYDSGLEELLENYGDMGDEFCEELGTLYHDGVDIVLIAKNIEKFGEIEEDYYRVGVWFAVACHTLRNYAVAWVPALLAVRIHEYDGSEIVRWNENDGDDRDVEAWMDRPL